LILPTLDERENVERFIPLLLRSIPEIGELIVVDDGSSDGTGELVERLGREDSRIRLIRRDSLPCLTASIQEGVDRATCELVGWMDADLPLSPSDFEKLLREVQRGADVAVASRFAIGGGIKGQSGDGLRGRLLSIQNLRTTEDPWVGVMLSWALNAVVLPAIVGLGVRDYTSGIIVARREALSGVRLRGDHGEYFIRLWADFLASGLEVVEVGYRMQPRRFGRSKTFNRLPDYAKRGVRYLEAGLAARRSLVARRR
jgi:dolichol-phosphate mannosyltransferase